jgi:hypothetical protein
MGMMVQMFAQLYDLLQLVFVHGHEDTLPSMQQAVPQSNFVPQFVVGWLQLPVPGRVHVGSGR